MIRAPWRDVPGRPPAWLVFLPNGTYWSTNDRAAADGDHTRPHWDVTGTPPAITVTPALDVQDRYRPWNGHIRRGKLVAA